jgi:hypothetical protein
VGFIVEACFYYPRFGSNFRDNFYHYQMEFIRAFTIDNQTFYSEESPNIPLNSPFGNLGEKYLFLMYRLNFINDSIKELYDLNEENMLKKKNFIPHDDIHLKIYHRVIRFSMEIKQIMDEMICFYYVLYIQKRDKVWPKKIEIDSIGKYIDKKNTLIFAFLENHQNTLDIINSIGNATKHSFVNTEITWLENKTSEPLILGYLQKQNDTKNKVQFHHIKLSDFIIDFNKMLVSFRDGIKNEFSL